MEPLYLYLTHPTLATQFKSDYHYLAREYIKFNYFLKHCVLRIAFNSANNNKISSTSNNMSHHYYYKNNYEYDDTSYDDSDDDQESYQYRQGYYNSYRNQPSNYYSGRYQNANPYSRERDRDYCQNQYQYQYCDEFSSESTSSDSDSGSDEGCDDWTALSHADFVEDCIKRQSVPLLYCLFAQDRDTRLYFVKIGATNRSVEHRAAWIPLDEAMSPLHSTWCCKEDEYLTTTTATRTTVHGIGNIVVTESNNNPVPCNNPILPASVSIPQPQKPSLYRRKPQTTTTATTTTTTTAIVTIPNIQKPNNQDSHSAYRHETMCIKTTPLEPTGISRQEAATKIIDIEQDFLDICHDDYPNQAQEASQAFTWSGKTECAYVSRDRPAALRAFHAISSRIRFLYQDCLVETNYRNQFAPNPTR
jgi:hypothetical protein